MMVRFSVLFLFGITTSFGYAQDMQKIDGSSFSFGEPVASFGSNEKRCAASGSKVIWSVPYCLRRCVNRLRPGIRVGARVTSMSGLTLFQQFQDNRFTPYNNVKLITAAAALHYLGPDYKFKTQIFTDGIIDNGVIQGNVYLKGTGDPSLRGTDVIAFIAELAQRGITTVTGGFYCDYYDYDEKPYVDGVPLADAIEYWSAPVFAMIDDRNYVDRSYPGRNIFGFIMTCNEGSQLVEKIEITNLIQVFSTYVQQICQAFGITVLGEMTVKKVPDEATILVDYSSAPLTKIITDMLKEPINIYADSLFKRIGAHCFGVPGTWAKGAQAVADFLEQQVGIPRDEFHLEDGSGISVNNAISPANMVKFLSWMGNRSPQSAIFMDCLPILEQERSLRGRIKENRAKFLTRGNDSSDIATLSGFVVNSNSKPVAIFSIMFDGIIPPKDSAVSPSQAERDLASALTQCLSL